MTTIRSVRLHLLGGSDSADGETRDVSWIRACEASSLADGDAAVVDRAPDPPIAVFNVDGEFYAVDDTCTHDAYSLADGYVDGDVVECPLHRARFDIRTGKVLCRPARRDLTTYPVRIEDGVVYVQSRPVSEGGTAS